MKLPVLPAYYYLDHFVEMLEFVQKTYGSILGDEHRAFIARFDGLSQDARCLLIRMVNRRGAIFNRSLFSYPESQGYRPMRGQTASERMLCDGEEDEAQGHTRHSLHFLWRCCHRDYVK
jgi:hypothetical protein